MNTKSAVSNTQLELYETQFKQILQDRYQFKELKGQGSYGVVANIYDKKFKQNIAMKKTQVLQHKHQALLLLRELSILKNLKSNLILKLKYAICVPENNSFRVYMVTDLWPTNLYQILMDKGVQITKDHQKFLAYQIILGIYYLHEQKILHRDLKSSNILVNADSELALCDFSLSRVAIQDAYYTKYVATRFYRAPELISQNFEYDGKIDVWSFGCIFYEILKRETLFKAQSTKQLKELFLNKFGACKELLMYANDQEKKSIDRCLIEPKKISSYFEDLDIDKDALDLLDQCLNLDPQKRLNAFQALKHQYFEEYFDEQHIDFQRQDFNQNQEAEEGMDLNQLQEQIIKTVNELNEEVNEKQYEWSRNKLKTIQSVKNLQKHKKNQLYLQMKFITYIFTVSIYYTKIHIQKPESLKEIFNQRDQNDIQYNVSTFGDISYLKEITAEIILPQQSDNETGCQELQFSKEQTYKDKIWLLKRSNCSYSKKAYNAQKSGAIAVLVYHDDPNQNINQILIVDDPKYVDIRIPVIMISYNDGVEIRKQLQTDQIQQFKKPGKQTDIVSAEFWMNPLSIQSYEFITDFKSSIFQFKEKIKFQPMYKFQNLVGEFQDRFLSQHCVQKGLFCQLDAKNYQPITVIQEGIRQICIWNLSQQQNDDQSLWWNYIEHYKQCIKQQQQDSTQKQEMQCHTGIYEDISLDQTTQDNIQHCIDTSFTNKDDQFESNNSLLESNMNPEKYQLIYIVPVFLINGEIVKENLKKEIVKGAICDKLIDQPNFCQYIPEIQVFEDYQIKSQSKNITLKVTLLILGVIILFLLILLFIQKLLRVRFQQEINQQIQSTIMEYTKLN